MRTRESHNSLTAEQITAFEEFLRTEEREQTTIEKYLRNIRVFATWLDNAPVTKSAVIAWKEHLLSEQYAPATVNAALASLNAFFKFAGWQGAGSRRSASSGECSGTRTESLPGTNTTA